VPLDDADAEEPGLPVIGRVAAGVPIDSVAHIEKTVPVRAELFSAKPDYLLRVQGDSMINVGIYDGDLLAVRKSETARDGDIVVARVEGEVTVKRLVSGPAGIQLRAENPAYAPILIDDPSEFFIEGHAVGVIRTAL